MADQPLIPPVAPEPTGDRVPHIPPCVTYAQRMLKPPASEKVPWCHHYSEMIAERFCEEIAKGRTANRICIEEEWSPPQRTLYTWFKNHPEFREAYDMARQICGEQIAHDILDVAYSRIPVEDKRQIIDAHKWLAGKMNENYRDRKIVEQVVDANVNVNTVEHIDVSGMTTEELLVLESAFNKVIELQANQDDGEGGE